MLSTKSRLSKTLLALLLALILTVSILPMLDYSASAATYFAVTGTITDAGMNTIVICTSSNKYRTFSKEDAQIVDPSGKGIALGDTVKITYSKDNPSVALKVTVVKHSGSSNRVEHDPNVRVIMMGEVRDIDSDYITISNSGRRYSFGIDDAHILCSSDDGILVGDKVRVIFYSEDPSEAVQVLMVSPGNGHDRYSWHHTRSAANRSFTGWIQDMGNHAIVVQSLESGMTMTFYYDEDDNDFPELAIGDVVKVLYNDENPAAALRVVMVDQGNNH